MSEAARAAGARRAGVADEVDLDAREAARLDALHRYETELWAAGRALVGGVDEVGRGTLAGPVVAGCVVLAAPLRLRYLDDSKRVTAARRLRLVPEIAARARAVGIGAASAAEIDALGIVAATELAMVRAIEACAVRPDALLVDAMRIGAFDGPQRAIVDGDAQSAAIAAASIAAKVRRDALMTELDAREGGRYGFAAHKGYGTPDHLRALRLHGPGEEHRRTFAPVRAAAAAAR